MNLDGLNKVVSIKEQREVLLKLNQDLLAGVYSVKDEKDNALNLELVDNVLTCYQNHFEELKGVNYNDDITIINLGALRKGKIEVFSGDNIVINNPVLLSNGVLEFIEAKNKKG